MSSNTKIFSLVTTVLAVLFVATGSFAEVINFDDCWGEAGFNLIDQDAAGVEIVFSVPEINLMEMELDGEIMQNVLIPGVILPNDAGAPNLPGMGRFIAIPQGASAEIEIVEYRTEVFHNMNIAPAFEIPKGNDDRPLQYRKNPDIYGVNADYPAEPVMVSELRKMRGVDVVALGITPFQYNPVTKDLTVYKDVRVNVRFYGGNGYFGEDRLRSRWWEPVLQQNLINYSSLPQVEFVKPEPTDEDNVEYIIIVPDDPVFLAWADTLKQWRNEQGIITGITTLTEIGGNNTTLIENYINNAYNTWVIPPVAVLLLSDYQTSGDVYGIASPTWNGYCSSDNMYADIDGDDLPELNIARITAQNGTHLSTMINKMLSYERNPYTDPGFYDDPLIAGGWQSDRWFILCCDVIWGYFNYEQGKRPERQYAGYSGGAPSSWSTNPNTYMIIDYFGPGGLDYIPTTPSHLTNWTGNATGINNAINEGTFIVQHRDHGSVTGWGTPSYNISNLSGLTNDQYPYVFSINCLTGQYDGGTTCFTEAFHRMEHGALGVLAASDVSYSFVNDTFVWGMYDSMFPDFDPGYGDPTGELSLRPGFANASGKYYLEASSWPYNPTNKDETYHLFHHHGDAFLTIYSEVPQNLTVLHADAILGGINEFTVTADADALIGLSVDGEYLAAATATGGPVTMSIDPLTPGQIMRVTVTKGNYFRYMDDVNVIPPSGPYVIIDECTVVDNIGWNPNGQLDYDETSKLTLTVQNIGVENAPDVDVTISTSDPLLTIIDGSENYGTVNASSTATVPEGFEVEADAATPDGHIFVVNMTATSGVNVWESSFAITGHAPILALDRLTFDDPTGNNNGWLDPGETADMDVIIVNDGSSPGVLLQGVLGSLDPLLTINTSSGSFGTIAPAATGSGTFSVTADPLAPQEHLADVHMDITGQHDLDADLDFQVMIGNILYDPTGPDAYGYLAYDPFDAPETPVYDWVEICADSGGPGTRVNITTDDTTFVFPLPFTFQYYGVTYNDFTVAANGWVGMGEVRGDDYSNSGIPDLDGPAPMIAPYWEDLSPARTNSGGVWTWYDDVNHFLVVEWNHIEQYAPTGAFETFQVILFDPAHYPTSTNDGRIKYQYKDMSVTATTAEGTVGIENPTETIGLQYFFDGSWDIHAHHIENEFAILFTTAANLPQLSLDLTYVSGSPVPAGGGDIFYELYASNDGTTPAAFDGWLEVAFEGGTPTTLAQRTFSNFLPGWAINRPDMYFPVPGGYAAGNYTFGANLGVHPDVVYAGDTFPFVKQGMANSGIFKPFVPNSYFPNPFDQITTGGSDIAAIPEEYTVSQNYPNPFNPMTSISFSLPEAVQVKLTVFNIQGRVVAELVNGMREAGVHEAIFDASSLASGLYFYRIEAGDFSSVRKMVLMK